MIPTQRSTVSLLVAAPVLLMCASIASAQSAKPDAAGLSKPSLIVDSTPNATFIRDPQTYGTQDEIAYVIPSTAFSQFQQPITWYYFDGRKYVTNNTGCCLHAPVVLPTGAALIGFEVEGCDNSTVGQIKAYVYSCPTPVRACVTPPATEMILTGIAETPGCAFYRLNYPLPVTINNAGKTYSVVWD